MAVGSNRTQTIIYTGDVIGTETSTAAYNSASPGQVQIITLSVGANTITAPTGGSTPTAVTIIPPTANTTLITLKGITGDTGIPLHKTDPTTIAVDTTLTTFVLTVGTQIVGARLFWT